MVSQQRFAHVVFPAGLTQFAVILEAEMMSPESRRSAGILLVILPTVIFGGVSILSLLISPHSGYMIWRTSVHSYSLRD